MAYNDNGAFDVLDKLTSGALSTKEKDKPSIGDAVKRYANALNHILETKVLKTDTPETVLQKVSETIEGFRSGHNLRGDEQQIRTLYDIIRNKGGFFVSDKQRSFFRLRLKKDGKAFDPLENAFCSPLIDHRRDSDIGVIYEAYRFGAGKRNFGFTYFFIDEKGVRLVVEQKLIYKRINVPRNFGFSKDRPWHTRARRNEMNSGVERYDEDLFPEESILFRRKG